MGSYVTVSAKVRRELVERAKQLGINLSELIRRAIEEEVRRRRLAILEEELRKRRSTLDKIDVEEVVEIIRKDRELR